MVTSKEYTPTKAERAAIESAFARLLGYARSEYEINQWAKQEARGYGRASDKCPLIMAKALLCKWFLHGAERPGALLRDTYDLRPAATWVMGFGAARETSGKVTQEDYRAFEAAHVAHEAAFNRARAEQTGVKTMQSGAVSN